MNMRKVATVSRVRKFEKSAVMRCNAYTLCEVENAGTGNSSRYGLAFYIRQIRRTTCLASLRFAVDQLKAPSKYGAYVIPVQTAMG